MSSEDIKIECDCGYVVSVPATQLESTESCINCGAVLDMNRVSAAKPMPAQTPISEQAKAAATPRSPFEDPDEEEEFKPIADDTTEPSPYTPTPDRDVNPFEDADEPTDSFGDDSGTLASEADTPKTYTNEAPEPDPSKLRTFTDAEHKNAYRGVEKEELCPRCGNPYRGEWDKKETIQGEMCFICSNQAVDGVPLRLQTEAKKKAEAEEQGVLTPMGELRKKPQATTIEKQSILDTDSPTFKMFVAFLGFATILLTIYLWQTDDFQTYSERHSVEDTASTEIVEEETPEVPAWMAVVILVWNIFAALVAWFLGLYVVLYLREKLPHERLSLNIMVIGWVQFVIIAFVVAAWFLLQFMNGTMLLPFFWVASFILGGFLIIKLYLNVLDFKIFDFFLFGIVFGFSQMFVQYISMFFKWGMASIFL